MFKPACINSLMVLAIAWQPPALAFRNCAQQQDTAAYRGSSAYTVSEIEFDEITGTATGTETHYNFSNTGPDGLHECHVTYELQGVYEQGSALLLLHANRSNLSQTCDPEFVAAHFPVYRAYTLQIDPPSGDRARVRHADNGDAFASADWHPSYMTFATDEVCELM